MGNSAVVEVRYVGSLKDNNFQSLDANPASAAGADGTFRRLRW